MYRAKAFQEREILRAQLEIQQKERGSESLEKRYVHNDGLVYSQQINKSMYKYFIRTILTVSSVYSTYVCYLKNTYGNTGL